MDVQSLLDLMRARRSIRRYRPDPVPDEMLMNIVEAARWAPSGSNAQPWEFVIVRDEKKRARIAEIFVDTVDLQREIDEGFGFPMFTYLADVPVTIVVCSDVRLNEAFPVDCPEEETRIQSVAAAIQNMMLAATAQGLATVWLTVRKTPGHPADQQGKLKALLEIPAIYSIDAVIPVGYPHGGPSTRWRKPLEQLVHYDGYDLSRYPSDEEISTFMLRRTFRHKMRESV